VQILKTIDHNYLAAIVAVNLYHIYLRELLGTILINLCTTVTTDIVANFTFFEPCVVIYPCNKNQQKAHFYINVLI